MATIINLLEEDHLTVKDALRKIREMNDARRREQMLQDVTSDLELHMMFEETVFYPEAREATGMDAEVDDDLTQHEEAKDILHEILGLDSNSEEWADKLAAACDLLEHHISDEEEALFPAVRDALPEERIEEMGGEYRALKQRAAAE